MTWAKGEEVILVSLGGRRKEEEGSSGGGHYFYFYLFLFGREGGVSFQGGQKPELIGH